MKYIRCKHRGIFIFPLNIDHSKMASWVGEKSIISAGFVKYDYKKEHFVCEGHSMTLDMSSLPEDTEILLEQGLFC